MFENVREDIRVAAPWHEIAFVRKRFGETGVRVWACIFSMELQAVLVYRLQAWLRQHRIPVLPGLCRRLTMLLAGVTIGDFTIIGPGLRLNHGHVVIDGFTALGRECSISPFVTIGLDTGGATPDFQGPKIGGNVFIGTGAKVLGPITVGDNARIGANAVVLTDVPKDCTAVGVPARVLRRDGPFGNVIKDPAAEPGD